MRIIYFHQHFSTPEGSGGIRSYQMARKLIESGHQVTMVCGSYGGGQTGLYSDFIRGKRTGNVNDIDVIEYSLVYSNADSFLKRTLTFARFAAKSIGLALTEKYDLAFATSTPLTAGIPGILARWLRGKPFVFEVRDLWPELPKAMGVITNPLILSAMSILEWASYRSANHCIGLSPGIVEGIKACGVSEGKISLVTNGCDLVFFGSEVESWRPDTLDINDFMALYTGTHGIANGLDAALNVAAELKRRKRNDIKLVLIGQGKLKPSLQSRAYSDNLDNIVFHDPVNKRELAGLIKSADVGMQLLANVPAFYYGTSPNKFFDYISAGLPVLINYPGWLAEMIAEHKCGYSVVPDDASAFADALCHAADHKDQLPSMSINSLKLATQEFDRQVLSKRWVGVLEGVMREA